MSIDQRNAEVLQITDSSNIADAYALMPLVWVCGMTVGYVSSGFGLQ